MPPMQKKKKKKSVQETRTKTCPNEKEERAVHHISWSGINAQTSTCANFRELRHIPFWPQLPPLHHTQSGISLGTHTYDVEGDQVVQKKKKKKKERNLFLPWMKAGITPEGRGVKMLDVEGHKSPEPSAQLRIKRYTSMGGTQHRQVVGMPTR